MFYIIPASFAYLSGRGLSHSGLEDVSHKDFFDLFTGDSGFLDGEFERLRAELRRRKSR